MGKKAEGSLAVLQSLFSGDNPFRRKAQAEPSASTPPPAPDVGLRLSEAATECPSNGDADEATDAKKRKREKGKGNANHSSTPNPNLKKRKKLEIGLGEGERPSKEKTKKRKRSEIEEEYERCRLGVADTALEGDGEGAGVSVAVGEKRKADDVVSADMVVSKESYDDESKLVRTVFIGNLPLKTKRKALLKEFGMFGEIESVRIRSVPIVFSKIPRKGAIIQGKVNDALDSVHAYIVFKNEQSANAALSLNMAQFGGNHIRVDMACPPRKKLRGEGPLYDRKRTVFVGNLPFDVKDEEIYQLFCGASEAESAVEAVRVIRDSHTSLGKGIAYVLFKTRDAANSIVRRSDLMIRDRTIRVCHARASDATPSKRKEIGQKREPPRKRFAETSGETAPGDKDKPKVRVNTLSYQGLRSRKSGAPKSSSRARLKPGGQGNHNPDGGTNQNVRKTKRPAVAARKAKQLLKKRKPESNTPEKNHRNKKPRRD